MRASYVALLCFRRLSPSLDPQLGPQAPWSMEERDVKNSLAVVHTASSNMRTSSDFDRS